MIWDVDKGSVDNKRIKEGAEGKVSWKVISIKALIKGGVGWPADEGMTIITSSRDTDECSLGAPKDKKEGLGDSFWESRIPKKMPERKRGLSE